MKINNYDAERLQELYITIAESLEEFKSICRGAMTKTEYEQFRYKCLGNCEPAISGDSEWFTGYSAITTLEKIAQDAQDEAVDEDDEERDDDDGKD